MSEPVPRSSLSRLAYPLAVSLLAAALLAYKSTSSLIMERYSVRFAVLFIAIITWAGSSWWVALDKRRFLLFSNRIGKISPGLLVSAAILIVCLLFILDLSTDFMTYLGGFIEKQIFALCLIFFVFMIFATLLLASENIPGFMARAAVMAFSCVITLLIAEIVFRFMLVEPKIPSTENQFKKLISSRWPEQVRIEKKKGVFRILSLADSFGEAGGWDNYVYLLRDMIRRTRPRTEMVSIFNGGYEIADEEEAFNRFGIRYAPDLVIHGFFVGNDFAPPQGPLFIYKNIPLRIAPGESTLRPNGFYLRQWIARYITALGDRLKKKKQAPNTPEGFFSHDSFLAIEHRFLINTCLNPTLDAMLNRISANLDRIREQAAKAGAKYVMVIHPDRLQVEPSLRREIETKYGIDLEKADMERPQKMLRRYCKENGIPYVDLLPAFKAHAAEQMLYVRDDIHYNNRGNELAAREIFRYLRDNGLI